MSYYLRVFCKSSKPLTRRQLVDFIQDGVYFDEPTFEPASGGELDVADWELLTVRYEEAKRPILFHRNFMDRLLSEEIAEVLTADLQLVEKPSAAAAAIVAHLKTSQQVLAIEIDQAGMSDEAWAMVDCLEAFVAKNYDGLVYAPDDGFFNAKLDCIYML